MLFSFCFSEQAQAQDRSFSSVEQTGVWNGLYIKARLSDRFGYHGEHHYRIRNAEGEVNSFIGRPSKVYNRLGLNIFFNDYFEAVIGPTLVLNFSPSPGNEEFEKLTLEPRIWHQWVLKMPAMGRFKVYHQFRFEHRWRRNSRVGSEYEYTNRFRYKLLAYIPINNKKIEEKTFYFSPSAEIFMHEGKHIVYAPFEDFRVYNGFGYVLNSNITFFAGHMWTIGQKPTGFEYAQTHILRFNVFVGLDFRNIEDRLPPINIGY